MKKGKIHDFSLALTRSEKHSRLEFELGTSSSCHTARTVMTKTLRHIFSISLIIFG